VEFVKPRGQLEKNTTGQVLGIFNNPRNWFGTGSGLGHEEEAGEPHRLGVKRRLGFYLEISFTKRLPCRHRSQPWSS